MSRNQHLIPIFLVLSAVVVSACSKGAGSPSVQTEQPAIDRNEIPKIELSQMNIALKEFQDAFVSNYLSKKDYLAAHDSTATALLNKSQGIGNETNIEQAIQNLVDLKDLAGTHLNRVLNSRYSCCDRENIISKLTKKSVCSSRSVPRLLKRDDGILVFTYYDLNFETISDCYRVYDVSESVVKNILSYFEMTDAKLFLNGQLAIYTQNEAEQALFDLKVILLSTGTLPSTYSVQFLPWLNQIIILYLDFSSKLKSAYIEGDDTILYHDGTQNTVKAICDETRIKLKLLEEQAVGRTSKNVIVKFNSLLDNLSNIEF